MQTISVIRTKHSGRTTYALKVIDLGPHVADSGIRYAVETYTRSERGDYGYGGINVYPTHGEAAAAYREAGR